MHMQVKTRGQCQVLSSNISYLIFFRQVLSLKLNFTHVVIWLAIKLLWSLVSTSQHWDYKYGCQQPALPHEHYEPEIRSPAICCDSPNIYMCTALNFFHVSWVWLFPHSQVTQMVIWRMETYLPWLCLSSLGSPSLRMVASCTFFLYCSFTSLLWQETWWSFLL